MEDFWNEITTTENEEKIEDEKPFDIDVDVKEKQLEIENAIEDSRTTKVSFCFNQASNHMYLGRGLLVKKESWYENTRLIHN